MDLQDEGVRARPTGGTGVHNACVGLADNILCPVSRSSDIHAPEEA